MFKYQMSLKPYSQEPGETGPGSLIP